MVARRAAVVVFCGNPERDERQKGLPPRFLSRLHEALLWQLRTLDADVYVARHDDREFFVADANWPAAPLGTQIETALRFCFDRGHSRVVIVAGDAPVDATIVRCAIVARGPAIAASRDGGFALAAFSTRPDIDWHYVIASRADAARRLREAVHPLELPRVDDIDTPDDARRIICRPALQRLIRALASLAKRFAPARHRIVRPCERAAVSLRAPPLHV